MSKIIKLDKNLANQIAAGEVVERPVSVVKELVENSIDAGATMVKVEIVEGGISEMIITDNGEGIDKEDLKIVLEKYTTSKIKTLDDLYNIMTFGFRWEALSSISSVSKFKIISRTNSSDFGYFLEAQGWDEKNFWEIASEIWTKIIVKDLFCNTPARLNYLKKPRTEYSKIKEFLEQIALSYPNISFELINDWKTVFIYRENENLKTRIYNIYWEKFSENLLEINYELAWLNIVWYISDPKIAFSNRNKQVLFVNNRIIKSPLIIKSIQDAYNRFIPHWEHPWYVLNIQVDPTQIDVNVHPRKLEVRFANESTIFRWFYHAIQDNLNNVSLIVGNEHINSENIWNENTANKQEQYYTWSWTKFKSYSPYKNTNPNPSQISINDSINFSKKVLNDSNIPEYNDFEKSTDLHDTPMGKIIWQMHNSFIVVQTQGWIQILDQHALAERIIYEKLIKENKSFFVQWLLIWESVNLTTKELDILEQNKQTFLDMWFEFEILWWWIVMINAIADFIKKEDLANIFTWIISDIWEQNFSKSNTLQEIKNKIFAYTSCRSAIKFGHKLNLFEMNKLLNDAVLDYSATCPHGRPVVYDIWLDDLKGKYER